MPWEHCGNSVLDDQSCPDCGLTKAQWTVQINNTRVLQISRKVKPKGAVLKVRLYEGGQIYSQGEPYRITFPDGSAVEGTTDRYGYAKHPVPPGPGGGATIAFPNRAPAEVEAAEAAPGGGAQVRLTAEGVNEVRLVAPALPLRLRYRTAHAEDVVPVKERHVALELPSARDAGFQRFRTDAEGWLHAAGEGGTSEATLARVIQPEDTAGPVRLVVSRRPVEDDATADPDRVEEVSLEEGDGEAERHALGWVRQSPRLVLPLLLGPPARGTAQERARRLASRHRFRVQVDGSEVPSGTHVTEEGGLEVVFRVERGRHQVQVSSVSDAREVVYYARRVRVR